MTQESLGTDDSGMRCCICPGLFTSIQSIEDTHERDSHGVSLGHVKYLFGFMYSRWGISRHLDISFENSE